MAVDIIYIAGMTRSGTTIVDRVLSSVHGVASFCEIRYLWAAGFVRHFDCSCGQPFERCPFWRAFSQSSGIGGREAREILDLQNRVDRSRYFWAIRTGLMTPAFRRDLDAYRSWMAHAYKHLALTAKTKTLIDSSKNPTTVAILADLSDINVHVIHVVRDLRAVIHSWRKKKYNPGADADMPQWSAWQTMATWSVQNLACQNLAKSCNYHLVRYEDFARAPQKTIASLIHQLAPISNKTAPFLNESTIKLPRLHSVSGNPDRFSVGETTIRPDVAWHQELDSPTRIVGTLVGFPLLRRYGYRLCRESSSDA
jgi:hypothetical protein